MIVIDICFVFVNCVTIALYNFCHLRVHSTWCVHVCLAFSALFAFNALKLLVWRQEEPPVYKN